MKPLNADEQMKLRKAVAARVFELSELPGAKPKNVLFRELYASLKMRYQIGSYREIHSNQFQDALRFIKNWEGKL